MDRRPGPAILTLMLLGAAALAHSQGPPARAAVQGSGTAGPLFVSASAAGPMVHGTAGDPVPTFLPPAANASAVVELSAGWAVTATVPTGQGQRAAVVVAAHGRQRRLPRLPGPQATLQERPMPLAVDGQLLGLAWLEGDDYGALSVHAADWNGDRWGPAELVSLPERGSQMALSATALADGRPLLVWSRFDGGDDEVVFSVRSGAQWTPPAPIHAANQVPDILPRVVAAAGGALAVWSQQVGDHYRVLVSRYDGSNWGMPRRLPGRGAAAAHLLRQDGRVFVLYESTAPRRWFVAELDEVSGRVVRTAGAKRGTEAAPAIETAPHGPSLVWPDGGRRVALEWKTPQ